MGKETRMQSSAKPAVSLPFFFSPSVAQLGLKGSQKLRCMLQKQIERAPREVLSVQFKKQERGFLRVRERGGHPLDFVSFFPALPTGNIVAAVEGVAVGGCHPREAGLPSKEGGVPLQAAHVWI